MGDGDGVLAVAPPRDAGAGLAAVAGRALRALVAGGAQARARGAGEGLACPGVFGLEDGAASLRAPRRRRSDALDAARRSALHGDEAEAGLRLRTVARRCRAELAGHPGGTGRAR